MLLETFDCLEATCFAWILLVHLFEHPLKCRVDRLFIFKQRSLVHLVIFEWRLHELDLLVQVLLRVWSLHALFVFDALEFLVELEVSNQHLTIGSEMRLAIYVLKESLV